MLQGSQFLNIQNETSGEIETISGRIVTHRNATHEKRTRAGQALEINQYF